MNLSDLWRNGRVMGGESSNPTAQLKIIIKIIKKPTEQIVNRTRVSNCMSVMTDARVRSM